MVKERIADWLDDARRWMVLGLMKLALKTHEHTFIMLCKVTTLDIAMREQGIARIQVVENEDGDGVRLEPIYHNTTRH